jgi:hypothetical protein
MEDLLKTLPKWLLVATLVYVAVLLSYAVYDNRDVEFFPPKISAKPPNRTSDSRGPAADCIAKSVVETQYVPKEVVERDYARKQHFNPSEWRYFAIAHQSADVENRLNQIQPPPEGLVIDYDGSANDTFHVWYRGGGSGKHYTYQFGKANELVNPPTRTFFLADPTRVPAGIGTAGGVAVPIYFEVN